MEAVVFDCDGVLVDSEPISETSWEAVLGRYGYRATQADMLACRGTTSDATYDYFASRAELPPVEAFLGEVHGLVASRLATELEAFEDAVETVRALAFEGIPLAVASSSRRVELDEKLARFGFDRYLAAVVAGDEVAAGKPAPDLYLAAAAGLGLAPGACLAVEDAALGAEAAVAAGMRVVTVVRDEHVVAGHPFVDRLDAELILTWLGRR